MKKILIVDDSEIVLKILKVRLGFLGFHIDTVNDGAKCIKSISENEYDLLILDLMLPKLGGLEVVKKLYSDEYNKFDLPIIAMSGNDSDIYKQKSLELGVKFFVKKPFDLDDFEQKVIELLS